MSGYPGWVLATGFEFTSLSFLLDLSTERFLAKNHFWLFSYQFLSMGQGEQISVEENTMMPYKVHPFETFGIPVISEEVML